MTSGNFYLSGHIKGSRAYVTHDGFLTTTGFTSNITLILFNKKNTKAKLCWNKYFDNSLGKFNILISKFRVQKNVSKQAWGGNNGNYAWSGLLSTYKKGGFHLTSVNTG